MVSEAAWWLRSLFLFVLFSVAVSSIVQQGEDVACETLPSEIHIIKGQFYTDDKYTAES
jgi:hypothetical protein